VVSRGSLYNTQFLVANSNSRLSAGVDGAIGTLWAAVPFLSQKTTDHPIALMTGAGTKKVRDMQTRPVQMTDVIYNAADQSFEALVTVHDIDGSRKYACSINAPISTSFADAAAGLRKQAERRHATRSGMFSELQFQSTPPRGGRQRFDPKTWLAHIASLSGLRAA
jgi:hypothetical protein